MAEKKTVVTTITIIDDLDGKELNEGDAVKVRFGWNGKSYQMDLSQTNAAKLEKFITPYVESAQQIGSTRGRPRSAGTGQRPGTGSGRSKEELQAIRDWAGKNNHEVSPRGRIPAPVLEAFDAAHKPGGGKPAFSSP